MQDSKQSEPKQEHKDDASSNSSKSHHNSQPQQHQSPQLQQQQQQQQQLNSRDNSMRIPSPQHQLNNQQESPQHQIYTYKAPWIIYAMGFSSKPQNYSRIAIGSMNEDVNNEVFILYLDKEKEKFEKRARFTHRYAPTKLLWIPDLEGKYPDLLATSGENLKIWDVDDEKQEVKIKCDLKNSSEFNAPLTSFDWSCRQQNYIGTASIDTTCTLWDIDKMTVFTQLIAHDKEVYDICFSADNQIFASVGADGSCRQFDLRSLDHSTVLYETENNNPIVRLEWNKLDTNYLAIIEMDVNYVTLLDTRQPLLPVAKLKNHKDYVNAITWAPESPTHLCSVADDCSALIWDFSEIQNRDPQNSQANQLDPLLEYKAESEISNLSWSQCRTDLLSICYNKSCQVLNV